VDGDMQYPFDVASCIVWLADYVDIVLVFFDPIGQALCKRTMDVIRRLNDTGHAEKMQYYMSKADQVETELDRQRVLTQITMNLHPHIKNSHAFKLPTIYLPRPDGEDPNIPNAIQEVCQDIDTAIRLTVQKNLTSALAPVSPLLRPVALVLFSSGACRCSLWSLCGLCGARSPLRLALSHTLYAASLGGLHAVHSNSYVFVLRTSLHIRLTCTLQRRQSPYHRQIGCLSATCKSSRRSEV
jgi:hypothetical protein